jgi:DNA-binding NtrC family response regulator
VTEKRRVMFVDDDPAVLAGLRNMLYKERNRWSMSFVDDAARALAELRVQPCDVIVSDMRMPGMDGATLLTHVKHEFPNTIRIMLSGYAESEALERVRPALHHLLTKPCDSRVLRRLIEPEVVPLDSAPATRSKCSVRPTMPPSLRPRVLFVDDDLQLLRAIAALLRRYFDVVGAGAADEAFEHLRRDRSIVAVVTDMRMPTMNGVELLATVRRIAPSCRRLLFTGELDESTASHALADGTVATLIHKPCAREQLRRALDEAIASGSPDMM